jgi:hypothetical protein
VVNSSRRKQKVVVLMELHGAIIYTTKMSKQVTKSQVRDAVHMYPCELRCHADKDYTRLAINPLRNPNRATFNPPA